MIFFPYEVATEKDTGAHRPTWQRWFDVYYYLDEKGIEYDQILSVDASIMAKWDYPNIFEMNDRKFSALLSIDNLKWSYQSAMGYKDLFDGFEFKSCESIKSLYLGSASIRGGLRYACALALHTRFVRFCEKRGTCCKDSEPKYSPT